MGLLFKNIIPFEFITQLPRPVVHRLREIRYKQLEATNNQTKQTTSMANYSMNNQSNNFNNIMKQVDNAKVQNFNTNALGSVIEDVIDDLT